MQKWTSRKVGKLDKVRVIWEEILRPSRPPLKRYRKDLRWLQIWKNLEKVHHHKVIKKWQKRGFLKITFLWALFLNFVFAFGISVKLSFFCIYIDQYTVLEGKKQSTLFCKTISSIHRLWVGTKSIKVTVEQSTNLGHVYGSIEQVPHGQSTRPVLNMQKHISEPGSWTAFTKLWP